MEKTKVDNPQMLYDRYEGLKKLYFSPLSRRKVDDEGQEIPCAVDRGMLMKQFENMGCEVPLRPDQPFTPIQYQRE